MIIIPGRKIKNVSRNLFSRTFFSPRESIKKIFFFGCGACLPASSPRLMLFHSQHPIDDDSSDGDATADDRAPPEEEEELKQQRSWRVRLAAEIVDLLLPLVVNRRIKFARVSKVERVFTAKIRSLRWTGNPTSGSQNGGNFELLCDYKSLHMQSHKKVTHMMLQDYLAHYQSVKKKLPKTQTVNNSIDMLVEVGRDDNFVPWGKLFANKLRMLKEPVAVRTWMDNIRRLYCTPPGAPGPFNNTDPMAAFSIPCRPPALGGALPQQPSFPGTANLDAFDINKLAVPLGPAPTLSNILGQSLSASFMTPNPIVSSASSSADIASLSFLKSSDSTCFGKGPKTPSPARRRRREEKARLPIAVSVPGINISVPDIMEDCVTGCADSPELSAPPPTASSSSSSSSAAPKTPPRKKQRTAPGPTPAPLSKEEAKFVPPFVMPSQALINHMKASGMPEKYVKKIVQRAKEDVQMCGGVWH